MELRIYPSREYVPCDSSFVYPSAAIVADRYQQQIEIMKCGTRRTALGADLTYEEQGQRRAIIGTALSRLAIDL